MGEVNEVLGDLASALANFRSAWQHAERVGNRHLMGSAAGNMACTLLKRGELESAAEEFEKSINIQIEIKNPRGLAVCYNNLALLYHRQEMWGGAEDSFLRSLEIKRELGDIPGQISTLQNLSQLYQDRGRIPEAVETAELMIRLEREIDHPALYEDSLWLGKLRGQAGAIK